MGVVVYTALSNNEPYKQVDMGMVMTSGWLGGKMVSTLAQNARDVGSILALGTLFPIIITPMTLPIDTTSGNKVVGAGYVI